MPLSIHVALSLLSILWFYGYNIFMALNSLLCADVPLRNCSINQSITSLRCLIVLRTCSSQRCVVTGGSRTWFKSPDRRLGPTAVPQRRTSSLRPRVQSRWVFHPTIHQCTPILLYGFSCCFVVYFRSQFGEWRWICIIYFPLTVGSLVSE